MEQAIKKAKKSGFQTKYLAEISDTLNPLFWQCLGKTLGWSEDERNRYWKCPKCGDIKEYFSHHDRRYCGIDGGKFEEIEGKPVPNKNDGWLYYWYKFIEHLSEEKPADDFFTNLLK